MEVKVIHNATVQYKRLEVRDDSRGGAAVEKYQRQLRGDIFSEYQTEG